jgi:membrane-associated phospholipid phosphatase
MLKYRCGLVFILIHFVIIQIKSQDADSLLRYKPVPFKTVFHKVGNAAISPFTYNYGLNFMAASAGTYALVATNVDWKWNRLGYNHKAFAYSGMPSVAIGGLVPISIPLGLYIYGRNKHNTELQITGLALGQAALLGMSISSCIKVFTGRMPPGILDKKPEKSDYSREFGFGFLRRGAFDGWPSGHTMTAFAMATTLIELYPNNTAIRIGGLVYASTVGIGVSMNIHWLSDAFSGALLGYAIGKTVGRNFKSIMGGKQKLQSLNIYPSPNGLLVVYAF